MPRGSRIAIPVAAIGAMITLMLWFVSSARAQEGRLARCEERLEAVMEIRTDIRDIRDKVDDMLVRTTRIEAKIQR